MRKVFVVVGARPNFVKAAPLVWAARKTQEIDLELVITNQQTDESMTTAMLKSLGLVGTSRQELSPLPKQKRRQNSLDVMFHVGDQFERLLGYIKPEIVVVLGDVDSTLACSLVAARQGIAVAHVEAGLRSLDRTMPEEVNRVLVDAVADICFTTEDAAIENLMREGKPKNCIFNVGNVMVDTLLRFINDGIFSDASEIEELTHDGDYVYMTMHRPSNIDDIDALTNIVAAINFISKTRRILFPVHPRTMSRLVGTGLKETLSENITLLPPLGYKTALGVLSRARIVITDSGGIQEEATALRIPCVTIRYNTERPCTVKSGCNVLAGSKKERILAAYERQLRLDRGNVSMPSNWDGFAASRIMELLSKWRAS